MLGSAQVLSRLQQLGPHFATAAGGSDVHVLDELQIPVQQALFVRMGTGAYSLRRLQRVSTSARNSW